MSTEICPPLSSPLSSPFDPRHPDPSLPLPLPTTQQSDPSLPNNSASAVTEESLPNSSLLHDEPTCPASSLPAAASLPTSSPTQTSSSNILASGPVLISCNKSQSLPPNSLPRLDLLPDSLQSGPTFTPVSPSQAHTRSLPSHPPSSRPSSPALRSLHSTFVPTIISPTLSHVSQLISLDLESDSRPATASSTVPAAANPSSLTNSPSQPSPLSPTVSSELEMPTSAQPPSPIALNKQPVRNAEPVIEDISNTSPFDPSVPMVTGFVKEYDEQQVSSSSMRDPCPSAVSRLSPLASPSRELDVFLSPRSSPSPFAFHAPALSPSARGEDTHLVTREEITIASPYQIPQGSNVPRSPLVQENLPRSVSPSLVSGQSMLSAGEAAHAGPARDILSSPYHPSNKDAYHSDGLQEAGEQGEEDKDRFEAEKDGVMLRAWVE